MAEIVAKFDTVTKSFSLTVDGRVMADVDEVEFSKRCCFSSDESDGADADPEFRFGVTQRSEDEDTKLTTVTRTWASADGSVVNDAVGTGVAADARAVAQIAEYLGRAEK